MLDQTTSEGTELRTPRLLLRPFRLDDLEDVFEYTKDEEWARYTTVPQPYTHRDGEQYLRWATEPDWETRPVLAISLEGRAIGTVELRINLDDQVGELAYSVAREHWGHGYATEASRAVMDWGFRSPGLARIFAPIDPRNHRSIRVAEKLGMSKEGVLRSHRVVRGERVDDAVYGLLREEWDKGTRRTGSED